MKTTRSLFVAGLALLLCAGCLTRGPRFSPYQPETPATGALAGNRGVKSETLDASAFTTVEMTNRIPIEWRQSPTNLFTLGPGDVVEVEILGEANSKSTALVGPDGKIYYSLLPGLSVWGLTLTETKEAIEKSLSNFLRIKPEVLLTLKAVGSKRVWLLGNVQNPGVYSLGVPMTLLEAITVAGGTLALPGSAEGADLPRSFVMRNGELLPVDFYGLLRKGDLSQNIYLQPEDFVYLCPLQAQNIYVLGAVAQPTIVESSGRITLVAAITKAGGTIPFAFLQQVSIIRGSLSQPRIAVLNYRKITRGSALDVVLEPGDIVYVPTAPYKGLVQFVGQIMSIFVRTMAVNEGRYAVTKGATPINISAGSVY